MPFTSAEKLDTQNGIRKSRNVTHGSSRAFPVVLVLSKSALPTIAESAERGEPQISARVKIARRKKRIPDEVAPKRNLAASEIRKIAHRVFRLATATHSVNRVFATAPVCFAGFLPGLPNRQRAQCDSDHDRASGKLDRSRKIASAFIKFSNQWLEELHFG